MHTRPLLPHLPFYFIRHGETDWNRQNKVMGSMDIRLNDVGRRQAQEAAMKLAGEEFQLIISSPRLRAHETARIIADKTSRPILLEEGLTERVWGEAEGHAFDPKTSSDEHTPQGAESFSTFQGRVIHHVSSILNQQECPLIVSHGGVLKALAQHLGHSDVETANGAPFLFLPPEGAYPHWRMVSL